MCTGGEILAVGSALAGTYLQQQAADDAAERQQKIINQGAEENSRLQAKKADTITNFAKDTFDPTTRDQTYEAAATKNESTLKDALLSAQGGEGEVYQGTEGNLSGDYARSKAAATASATQDIMKRAKLLARSNAGNLMYNDEALKGGTLASDILGINASGSRNNSATQAGVGSVRNNGSVLGGLLVAGAPAIGSYTNSQMWGGV